MCGPARCRRLPHITHHKLPMAVLPRPVVTSVDWHCGLRSMWTRMAQRTALLFLFATLLVFGLMVRDGHAQASAAGQGVQRYMEYCAGCHGADAKGGDKAPSLVSAASPLSDSELFRIVRDGTTGGMPSFAQIGDANIKAVVQVLRVLATNGPAKSASPETPVTGNAQSGRALYFGKAQCSRCHSMQGKGGFIANNLTNYGRNRAADEILKAITTPDTPLALSSQVVTVTTSTGQKLTGVLR